MAKAKMNNVRNYNSNYQYGSAARNIEIARPLEKEYPSRVVREDRREERRRKEAARNNSINLAYTVFLIACLTAIFAICFQYLNLQSSVKVNSEAVMKMQDELNNLKAENNLYEAEINAGIDYQAIFDIAVNELGMEYPAKKQVINYESEESEYVKQYKNISAN